MLKENIKTLRKSKGLSQEELAVKINVVRQTISKWEQGLSSPDADMLITLSELFEIPVNQLLEEEIKEDQTDDLKVITEKLEVINLQLSNSKERKDEILRWVMTSFIALIVIFGIILALNGSSYLNWNYSDPQIAVIGTILHAFEWVFVRTAPFLLLVLLAGMFRFRKRQ